MLIPDEQRAELRLHLMELRRLQTGLPYFPPRQREDAVYTLLTGILDLLDALVETTPAPPQPPLRE